ncbi:hypothetical protein L596_012312 [Steinernema carpocapsae]|uniref:Endonuclease n=1 Tax=Steinernema carpocapsae TaxID=34508 RepID=A0A4U5NXB3_STECR|nr:hypothetical protein L596_012312 [Steinernema carpocapsae]
MIGRLSKIGGLAALATGAFVAGSTFSDWKRGIFPCRLAEATVSPARRYSVATADTPGLGPSRVSEIMRFGYPGFDNLRTFEDFVVSYDRKTRTAHWVFEHLTPERMVYDPSVDRSKCQFRPDESMHPYFQSKNEDYKGSSYDRGHLAAAGNHRKTQLSVDQTFLLSNMSPQVGRGFNRDKWNDLEKLVRKHAKHNPNVYVCTGPLYLPHQEADGKLYVKYKVIGKNHVAVPTHFFKVALIEKAPHQYHMECYVLPNKEIPNETPLTNFMVPLDSIERAAGFLLFEKVPKNELKMLNGKKVGGLW